MPLIESNAGSLSQSVARCVTKRTGMSVDALFWADQQIDPRLKLRIEVVGSDGLVIDADRDLAKLQDRLSDQFSKLQLTDVQEIYNDWPTGIRPRARHKHGPWRYRNEKIQEIYVAGR